MGWPTGPKLSRNFHLDEFERGSQGGEVPPGMVKRLRALCVYVLQPVRNEWGPIRITSGYRPDSEGSQHQRAEAADIHIEEHTRAVVWRWLIEDSGIDFDQAICYEDTEHIHVSYTSRRPNRREVRVHVTGADVKRYGTAYPLWSDYRGRLKDQL